MKFVKNEGPCLFVLQDMDGYIFGGFATESLSIRPQFVGKNLRFRGNRSKDVEPIPTVIFFKYSVD